MRWSAGIGWPTAFSLAAHTTGDEKVPRGKKASVTPVEQRGPVGARKIGKDDQWGGYVQCSLSETDREGYEVWLSENPTAVPALLVDILASGLKLTAVWDGANQCFIASLTGRPDIAGGTLFTCTLSARGGTLDEAIAVLVYKHTEVCGEDWSDWLINGPKSRKSFG